MKSLMSLSPAVLASVLALAACGGSQQTQASATPSNTESPPAQYGSTMSQPSPAGTTANTNDTPSSAAAANQANNSASPSTTTLGSPPTDTTGVTSATPTANPMNATPSADDISGLHDAEIASVLHTINAGEVEEAQLAETKAVSPEVKHFARHMTTDHKDMKAKDKALLTRIHVTPNDNALSTQLKTDGQSELTTLQGDSGKDFDRAYMDAQVKGHRHALDLIDKMSPNVKNPEFRAQIQGARARVEQHLQEAERIHRSLDQGTTSKTGGMGM
jgi:putative membrane protein